MNYNSCARVFTLASIYLGTGEAEIVMALYCLVIGLPAALQMLWYTRISYGGREPDYNNINQHLLSLITILSILDSIRLQRRRGMQSRSLNSKRYVCVTKTGAFLPNRYNKQFAVKSHLFLAFQLYHLLEPISSGRAGRTILSSKWYWVWARLCFQCKKASSCCCWRRKDKIQAG